MVSGLMAAGTEVDSITSEWRLVDVAEKEICELVETANGLELVARVVAEVRVETSVVVVERETEGKVELLV